MHKDFVSYIRLRSNVIFAIEQFFQKQDYISVHTPSLSSWLIPERHIDVFSLLAERDGAEKGAEKRAEKASEKASEKKYLVPSPEIYLKALLAYMGKNTTAEKQALEHNTLPSIYEFSHSFRKEVSFDAIHNDEFLMLEWYTAYANLQDSLEICNDMLYWVREMLLVKDWGIQRWMQDIEHTVILEMEEAFEMYAKISLRSLIACPTATDAIQYAGMGDIIHDAHSYDWEDVFHHILVEKIEPNLPNDIPVYLTHYPSRIDTLAKQNMTNSIFSERWELYIQGIEIANCFVEETDGKNINAYSSRQKEKMALKENARSSGIPYDETFLQSYTLPPYTGVAMGIDRLILCILSKETDNLQLSDVSPLAFFQDPSLKNPSFKK